MAEYEVRRWSPSPKGKEGLNELHAVLKEQLPLHMQRLR